MRFDLDRYLSSARRAVLDEIRAIVGSKGRYDPILYQLMLDYPLREAKGLRPALCMATCRALGGRLEAVLPSAAVLELYHNAFLVHDDIEDASLVRRGAPTLHEQHGVPIAVNVGDGMLSLALQPLLDNVPEIGLGPALRILQAVAHMCRETVEGQALELDWVRQGAWDLGEEDYVELVVKKTGWYSFITPVRVGCIAAGADEATLEGLSDFARAVSIAFQIQDDLLNLEGELDAYGKEIGGDLWEGKRTVMLLHALRTCSDDERAWALDLLARPRPDAEGARLGTLVDELHARGSLDAAGHAALQEALARATGGVALAPKTEPEVRALLALLERQGSLAHGREVAERWAAEASTRLDAFLARTPASVHTRFLQALVDYVHRRAR
ncbi:MAG: polyprenyl synthetase family protein [Alphaproteobacteria bacterium]|nr:polyprenyl synthetase family protein [Alphaproteobacteria bacterium]